RWPAPRRTRRAAIRRPAPARRGSACGCCGLRAGERVTSRNIRYLERAAFSPSPLVGEGWGGGEAGPPPPTLPHKGGGSFFRQLLLFAQQVIEFLAELLDRHAVLAAFLGDDAMGHVTDAARGELGIIAAGEGGHQFD